MAPLEPGCSQSALAESPLSDLLLLAEEIAEPADSPPCDALAICQAAIDTPRLPEQSEPLAHWRTTVASLSLLAASLPAADSVDDALAGALDDGHLLALLARSARGPGHPHLNQPDPDLRLSPREAEVLREVAADLPHSEIAAHLGISTTTVDTHLKRIYRKLGVQRPMQAVRRAAALGYLTSQEIAPLLPAPGDLASNRDGLAPRLAELPVPDTAPGCGTGRAFAELGLAAIVLGAIIARQHRDDLLASSGPAGVLAELDGRGDVAREFKRGGVGPIWDAALVPPSAASQGFTPGNLLVAHSIPRQRGLNRAAITELTDDGTYVRSFCGGAAVGVRLTPPLSIAFASDGRLLATSGFLTNAILAFSRGGGYAARFADGDFDQICAAPGGRILASSAREGAAISVFDCAGDLQGSVGQCVAGARYRGLAVDTRGRIFAAVCTHEHGEIETYDPEGRLLRTLVVRGANGARLRLDGRGLLYVPSRSAPDIKVLSSEGALVRHIHLGGMVAPHAVIVGERGRLWVAGTVHVQ